MLAFILDDLDAFLFRRLSLKIEDALEELLDEAKLQLIATLGFFVATTDVDYSSWIEAMIEERRQKDRGRLNDDVSDQIKLHRGFNSGADSPQFSVLFEALLVKWQDVVRLYRAHQASRSDARYAEWLRAVKAI